MARNSNHSRPSGSRPKESDQHARNIEQEHALTICKVGNIENEREGLQLRNKILAQICGNAKRQVRTASYVFLALSSMRWTLRFLVRLCPSFKCKNSLPHCHVDVEFQITSLHSQKHQGNQIVIQRLDRHFKKFGAARFRSVHFFHERISPRPARLTLNSLSSRTNPTPSPR